MKEVGKRPAAGRLRLDVQKSGCREVRKQDLATARRFAAYVFGEVANRHVDRVRRLVTELSKLSLVR